MGEASQTGQRALAKLVRYVAGREATLKDSDAAATVFVSRAGEAARPFSRAALDDARQLGLLVCDGARISATAQAAPFLRRAALSPEDGFQDQHREIEQRSMRIDDVRHSVRVNLLESPLGGMARLKEKSGEPFLSTAALDAGLRLHVDFTRAQLQPQLTMRYEPRLAGKTKGSAGGTGDLCDSALSARSRVRAAVEAIGPELSGVALDVCCFEKGLETVERERQWPVRSAKLMLRAALMSLARHYAPPPARNRRRAWGDEGFRPSMGDAVVQNRTSRG